MITEVTKWKDSTGFDHATREEAEKAEVRNVEVKKLQKIIDDAGYMGIVEPSILQDIIAFSGYTLAPVVKEVTRTALADFLNRSGYRESREHLAQLLTEFFIITPRDPS